MPPRSCINASVCVHVCVQCVCVYMWTCVRCPKRPTVRSERGWCRKINASVTAEPCQGGRVTHYPSDQPSPTQTHERKRTHEHTQMAAAVRSFCKLFPLLIHRSPFPAFVNFVHTLFSSSSCLSFVLLSGFLSGLMKYITRVLLSLVENACCIKWIDCLWLIFMVRAWRMYGQRGDGMWWRLKRGQILQLPPNWFPLVWWRE